METHRANSSGRRRMALIVDECAPTRAAIRDVLAAELECEEVGKLEQAIAAAGLRRPRVLICDAAIGGTGPELCRRVRADQRLREVPLILLSADTDPDRRAAALEQGADDYLSKPFAPRELLARVRSLVRLDDARQEALRQNLELERAHCELLEAQRQLLESERLATVGGLASELAHAINNPLSVVWAGFEELSELTRGIKAGDIEVVRSDIRGNLERIRGILQRLAVVTDRENRRSAPVDVHAEIDRAVAIAHARLSRVELKRRCEGPPTIEAPPGYLTQIVAPVLLNAAQAVASVAQPRIEIRTRHVEGGLEIVVEDNGVGIGAPSPPQVFDPFLPAADGSGHGLAVCQRLIDRLGGSAQLVSQAGRGTQFRISLPVSGKRPTTEAAGRSLSA
ncbi:MAG TPA: ATP-binding protein [Myxococcaceae bacterium]|nr:ATP-binding protein [Myxococcaceae bacterium]